MLASTCSVKSITMRVDLAEYGSKAPAPINLQSRGITAVVIIDETKSPSGPSVASSNVPSAVLPGLEYPYSDEYQLKLSSVRGSFNANLSAAVFFGTLRTYLQRIPIHRLQSHPEHPCQNKTKPSPSASIFLRKTFPPLAKPFRQTYLRIFEVGGTYVRQDIARVITDMADGRFEVGSVRRW